jgi:hypothetical protein
MKKGTSVVIDATLMELVVFYQGWQRALTGIRLSRTQAINGLVSLGSGQIPSDYFLGAEDVDGETRED